MQHRDYVVSHFVVCIVIVSLICLLGNSTIWRISEKFCFLKFIFTLLFGYEPLSSMSQFVV